MGFRMNTQQQAPDAGVAQRAFAQNETLKARWTKALPKNRELIDKIKVHGLQRI